MLPFLFKFIYHLFNVGLQNASTFQLDSLNTSAWWAFQFINNVSIVGEKRTTLFPHSGSFQESLYPPIIYFSFFSSYSRVWNLSINVQNQVLLHSIRQAQNIYKQETLTLTIVTFDKRNPSTGPLNFKNSCTLSSFDSHYFFISSNYYKTM